MKRPWVLKSPVHLARFDELFAVFPDATVVQCHRDLTSSVPSAAALTEAMRAPYCDAPDPLAAGRYVMDLLGHALDSNLEARARWRQAGKTILDVEFADVVADIDAVTRRIFVQAGIHYSATTGVALADWEASNPRHDQGKFDYEGQRYGLSSADIEDRFEAYLKERSSGVVPPAIPTDTPSH
jgi:hypothetical protein